MAGHDRPSEFSIYEPLTKRERDILALLGQDLSNQEIADHLVISLNTVKWYNRRIFDKLGVKNRRQAVARAKALHLIETAESIDVPPRHLPAPTTPFIGRSDELAQLNHLLDTSENRLITILAPGGMGKTRLALASADVNQSRFKDGAYFVPLAALVSPDQLLPQLADAVGLQLTSDQRTPQQQLLNFLSGKELLLVLDNFEHLLEGAALLADVLEAAPRVVLLVTSRERLNLNCESLYVLGGMTFPQQQASEDVLNYGAVQLFLECARRLQAQLVPEDMDAVIQICQMTQGLPLALELAAAWLVALSPSEVADEIVRGLEFLQANLRDIPQRQRSIIAVFEASWRHLSAEEQRVFRKLAVFHNGFTREAALAVLEAPINALMALANKALIARSASTGRFEIHELLRQFALEQLMRSSELETAQNRHAAYFMDFLNARLPILQSRTPQAALDEIRADFDNIRRAIFHLLDSDRTASLGGIAESLRLFFEADVHFSASVRHPGLPYLNLRKFFEARAHFSDDALSIFRMALAKKHPAETEAILREGLGDALQVVREYDAARQEFEQTRRLLPPKASVLHARLLRKRAMTFDAQRRLDESLQVLAEAEETLDQAEERGEAWWQEWIAVQNGIVSAHFFLGHAQPVFERLDDLGTAVKQYGTASEQFDFYVSANSIELQRTRFVVTEPAMEYAKLGLDAAQESGGSLQIAVAHVRLGITYICQEDWSAAEAALQAGLAIADRIGNVLTQTLCATFLGNVFRRRCQIDTAEQWAKLTLQIASSVSLDLYVAAAKANLAWVAWRRQEIEQAVVLAQEALAIWQDVLPNYPLRWQAHWILFGQAVQEGQFEVAVDYGHEILKQPSLLGPLFPMLSDVIQVWDDGNEAVACDRFAEVMTLASSLGCL